MYFLFARRSRFLIYSKNRLSWIGKTCYSKEEPQIVNRLVYA